jgi:predicted nucleotidyltransferase
MLNEFVFYISKVKEIKSIILFGSYSKNIFSDKSDVDIAVIYESKKEAEAKIISIADNLSKEYKKDIHVTFFSETDLKHKKDALIKDILRNGKKILM